MWFIVDRLSEVALFWIVKTTDPLTILCRLYIEEIVRRHGVPLSFVSDRDPRYVGPFEVIQRIEEVAYRLVLPP